MVHSARRANDIRFAAVFSKARRQRKMDVRAQKNAKEMQQLEKLLAELETEEEVPYHAHTRTCAHTPTLMLE